MPKQDVAASGTFDGTATAGEAVDVMVASFQTAGIDSPARDARLLVQSAVDLTREDFLLRPETVLTDMQRQMLEQYHQRRLAREPVSRILGHRLFYGRRFKVTKAVLDPRADSETIIDCVLSYVRDRQLENAPLRIIDVGTGSGCLVLTLLSELPAATGLGTDISGEALALAAQNAEQLGLSKRIKFAQSDGLSGIRGPFDILVTNPPYIARSVIQGLEPEVRNFDPHLALDGGCDGLDLYRALAPEITRVIPNGLAAFEIGYDQSQQVVDIFNEHCGRHRAVQISTKKDLAGRDRCVALQTQS